MVGIMVSMAILLSSTALGLAQDSCPRSMLQAATDSYIAAQTAWDLSKISLAPSVKYLENMQNATREKGLWNTALPIAFH